MQIEEATTSKVRTNVRFFVPGTLTPHIVHSSWLSRATGWTLEARCTRNALDLTFSRGQIKLLMPQRGERRGDNRTDESLEPRASDRREPLSRWRTPVRPECLACPIMRRRSPRAAL